MYYVTKDKHVRLEGGRSVVLRAGPREGEQAASLKTLLSDKVIQHLIKQGIVEERAELING